MLSGSLRAAEYTWPTVPLTADVGWQESTDGSARVRELREGPEDLVDDSRWPAFFPSPICLVTTAAGGSTALEKVVGASVVNRFPYVVALSFCRQELSRRHHVRKHFTELLERDGVAAIQFLTPGPELDRAMDAIATVPEERTTERIKWSRLASREGLTSTAPVLSSAYLVYEARLVSPMHDFEGAPIYRQPWVDVGSHRVYFLEVHAIQLRRDIAEGRSQIRWRSLPSFRPTPASPEPRRPHGPEDAAIGGGRYQKAYTPDYAFPSAGTIAFEADEVVDDMSVKWLPRLPEDQVEVDNDRARWPCFFPQSAGLITTQTSDGNTNVMPCGSTAIVSRLPFIVAPCISYAAINERYAPRSTLRMIRATGRFGCGVPFLDETVVNAIRYTGNTSWAHDPSKLLRSGLRTASSDWGPVLTDLPVHFDCEVVGEERLGTHIMILGAVRRVRVRADVTPENPISWCPWAGVAEASRGLVDPSLVVG